MRNKFYNSILFLLTAGLMLSLYLKNAPIRRPPVTPTTQESTQTQTQEPQEITLEEIGITLKVPGGYLFNKELAMNYTTNKPYAIGFVIQNYVGSPNETPAPYQLYGLYQWDTAVVTKEEFEKADFSLDPTTRVSATIDKNPAVKGVIKGERQNYFVAILVNGHILKLSSSGSSEEIRKQTDTILKSVRFIK